MPDVPALADVVLPPIPATPPVTAEPEPPVGVLAWPPLAAAELVPLPAAGALAPPLALALLLDVGVVLAVPVLVAGVLLAALPPCGAVVMDAGA